MTPIPFVARCRLFAVPMVLIALALGIAGNPAADALRAADQEPDMVPGGFGGRTDKGKAKLLKAEGGSAQSEAAVAAGLHWLVRHQNAAGFWNPADFHNDGKCNCGNPGHDDRVFGTALALLALLGAGETAKGGVDKPTHAKNVDLALKWLVGRQNQDGVLSANGYIQGMASIALCEAYGMTKDRQFKGPAQKAVNAIANWQGDDGGFRYAPKMAGDTSVSGWHIQALAAAKLVGLNIPNATLEGVTKFLDKVGSADGSSYGYIAPNGQPAPTQRMTAVGLLCREELGWKADNEGLGKGIEMLRRVPPSPAVKDMYYFYYATQVVHHVGGEPWQKWNQGLNGRPGLRELLVNSQDQGQTDGKAHQAGSWDPTGDAFGTHFGRLGYTAMCLLNLEIYYRHVPLYERKK